MVKAAKGYFLFYRKPPKTLSKLYNCKGFKISVKPAFSTSIPSLPFLCYDLFLFNIPHFAFTATVFYIFSLCTVKHSLFHLLFSIIFFSYDICFIKTCLHHRLRMISIAPSFIFQHPAKGRVTFKLFSRRVQRAEASKVAAELPK